MLRLSVVSISLCTVLSVSCTETGSIDSDWEMTVQRVGGNAGRTVQYRQSIASSMLKVAGLTTTYLGLMLTEWLNVKDKAVCTVVVGTLIAAYRYRHEHDDICDEDGLLDSIGSPVNRLQMGQKVFERFEKSLETIDFQHKNIREMLDSIDRRVSFHEQECSHFLMHECIFARNGSYCTLSRLKDPLVRGAFTKSVVGKIISASVRKRGRPVEYTSVGAGGLLTDYIILDEALRQKPKLNVNVNVIDVGYVPYLYTRRFSVLDGNEVTRNDARMELTEKQLRELLGSLKRNNLLNQKNEDVDLVKKRIVVDTHLEHLKHQQLLKCLSEAYPRARITHNVYAADVEYLAVKRRMSVELADVLVAADIEDTHAVEKSAPQAYVTICLESLRKNPHATNVMLGVTSEDEPVLKELRLKRS